MSASDEHLTAAGLPDTPAGRRLAELISLMPKATPARVIGYVQAHYSSNCARSLPLESRIASFMDWKSRGGMVVVEIARSEPHQIEAVVQHPVSQERKVLGLEVEPQPPHCIKLLMLGRAPLPAMELALEDQAAADYFLTYTGRLASAGLFSGAVLIARNGRILARKAWGLANRDFNVPNTLQTRFNVASINKTWTAVAIAQLVEAGALSFKDQVSKFIDYPDRVSAAKIRIEHLLTHTSGLQSYFNQEYDRTARKHLRTIDDFLKLSKDHPPAFQPGTDWDYSNTGYLVLGKVIEVIAGQAYCDYIQSHILDRAGMSRSGCFELDRVNHNLAVGYARKWSVHGMETINNLFEHVVRGGPAGGCYATVGDLFRFAEALKNGKLISRSMARILTTSKPELGSPMYGYGFIIHPQRALYGHNGGFLGISTNLDILEDPPGWTVVVLANDNGMRAPVLKARQLIGVTVPEPTTESRCLPTGRARPR